MYITYDYRTQAELAPTVETLRVLRSPQIVVLKYITQSLWYVQWSTSLHTTARPDRFVRWPRLATRQAQGPHNVVLVYSLVHVQVIRHRIGKRLVVQSTVSRAKQLARCTRQSLLQRVSNKDLPHLSFLYDPQDIIYGIICFSCKLSLHKYIFERDPQLIIALAGLGDFVRREVRNHIHTQRILCVWLCMYVYLHTGNHILTHIVT